MTTLQELNYTRLKEKVNLTWLTKEAVNWSVLSKKYYVVLESEYHDTRVVCKCSKTMKLLTYTKVQLSDPTKKL